jgi:hypothetical protein
MLNSSIPSSLNADVCPPLQSHRASNRRLGAGPTGSLGEAKLGRRMSLVACLRPGSKVPLVESTSLLSAAFDRAARAVAEGEDPLRWTKAMDLLLSALVADVASRQGG